MAANSVLEAKDQGTQLDDLLVGKIVELGCACPTDLAGQLGGGRSAKDLIGPLDALVNRGILRYKNDKSDTRHYNEYQRVYELAR